MTELSDFNQDRGLFLEVKNEVVIKYCFPLKSFFQMICTLTFTELN